MGTAVLRSQDCLRDRFHHEAITLNQHFRPRRNPNPVNTSISNPKSNQSRRRKRSPVALQPNQQDQSRIVHADRSKVTKVPAKNLVMGEVKILKRGEKLNHENDLENQKDRAKSEGGYDLVLGSTDRLGPDPEMVQKQIKLSDFKVVDGVYAGSAFVTSPPPSSLPVPAFLGKNGAATSDLRRLLGLDLL